jgi:hypothetical protein
LGINYKAFVGADPFPAFSGGVRLGRDRSVRTGLRIRMNVRMHSYEHTHLSLHFTAIPSCPQGGTIDHVGGNVGLPNKFLMGRD